MAQDVPHIIARRNPKTCQWDIVSKSGVWIVEGPICDPESGSSSTSVKHDSSPSSSRSSSPDSESPPVPPPPPDSGSKDSSDSDSSSCQCGCCYCDGTGFVFDGAFLKDGDALIWCEGGDKSNCDPCLEKCKTVPED